PPFTRVELAEHLEAVAGAPLSPDRLEDILARSEGNPFYAEQLLAAGAADARVELPATLAEGLLARVQGLSEPAQRAPRGAAGGGGGVPWRVCFWPGSRGWGSRPSGCCGWRRSWAAGCPTGCWPASQARPRPS